jgi:hypothetical protein
VTACSGSRRNGRVVSKSRVCPVNASSGPTHLEEMLRKPTSRGSACSNGHDLRDLRARVRVELHVPAVPGLWPPAEPGGARGNSTSATACGPIRPRAREGRSVTQTGSPWPFPRHDATRRLPTLTMCARAAPADLRGARSAIRRCRRLRCDSDLCVPACTDANEDGRLR